MNQQKITSFLRTPTSCYVQEIIRKLFEVIIVVKLTLENTKFCKQQLPNAHFHIKHIFVPILI